MFGSKIKVGLSDYIFPKDCINEIDTEEELQHLLDEVNSVEGVSNNSKVAGTNSSDSHNNDKRTTTGTTFITSSNKPNENDKFSSSVNIIPPVITEVADKYEVPNETNHSKTSVNIVLPVTPEIDETNEVQSNSWSSVNLLPPVNPEVGGTLEDSNEFNETLNENLIPNKRLICCGVCEFECSNGCVCISCNMFVHTDCCAEINENNKNDLRCLICCRKESIIVNRFQAKDGLLQQAKKMKLNSNKLLPAAKIGDTVRLPVPDVDRGRADARNILGVVTTVEDNMYYKIGTEKGTLPQLFTRNQFSVCPAPLIATEKVSVVEKSLREIAVTSSLYSSLLCGGQGYKRCSFKTKCDSKKCYCKAANILCNSKCHEGLSCLNK
ncbi:uncharacterized protein LOC126884022 [Diabrotica virgifera virgifera]|uniref:Uncharacterized protein n=1 Tax=Diabrotica virgifera virgifera TaxID=50390 RepID=A0ABM5K6E0_DIAVI|nr:uncharacterized protein LOC126884022 [Diabrotica virgifera virgifera]